MIRTTDLAFEIREIGIDAADVELRAAKGDAATPVFYGHAAVFDTRTAIGNPLTWGFYEELSDGAFTKTLKEFDQRFLVDHNTQLLVARVSAGDLRLSQDKVGVVTDADLDLELSYVRDLNRNVEKRRITGMSIGFEVVNDNWSIEEVSTSDGNTAQVEVRVINEVKLYEVSAVTFPAYEETDAAMRAVLRRSTPDPLGRRQKLLAQASEERREPGGSTRGKPDQEPAATTPDRLTLEDRMKPLASRYGLPL